MSVWKLGIKKGEIQGSRSEGGAVTHAVCSSQSPASTDIREEEG